MHNIRNIYFVGIGGIGMSALARYFHLQKYNVAGYDLTRTALTSTIENEGIPVTYEDNLQEIPKSFRAPDNTLVVYTPAIPKNHTILNWFQNQNFEIVKRAALLGKITRKEKSIAVAGTHGKTSISTFLAHLLYQSHLKCSAFLGGIAANYHTNLLYHENAAYTVIEADEYDRSFLHLNPSLSLISSIDADHLDIYENYDNIVAAFREFAAKTHQKQGTLVVKKDIETQIGQTGNIFTYSIDKKADYYPENVIMKQGQYHFTLNARNEKIENLTVNLPGTYNFENAIAAAALATEAGLSQTELRSGLASFKGVERRFQLRLQGEITYIDDYAHHPAEIDACIASAKAAFTNKKITVAFQPHLYSRTKDFHQAFARSLNKADEIIVLPIYPAREKPIDGVSSKLITKHLPSKKYKTLTKEELFTYLKQNKPELFISMGAGDIGHWTQQIEEVLQ